MSEQDLEARLAFVRSFATTSPYYKAMGMTFDEMVAMMKT